MENFKSEILDKICYTDLVYERVNKKLNIQLQRDEIEKMIHEFIKETEPEKFQKSGRNIYITNNYKNVRLTINSFTHRLITADRLKEKQRNTN